MRTIMIAISTLALAGLGACSQPAPEPETPPAETAEAPAPAPVAPPTQIMSVEKASIEAGATAGTFKVCAQGQTNTGGWTNVRLEPVATAAAPADGVYEFTFVGDPPTGPAPEVLSTAKAAYDWAGAPSDVKGVRVAAAGGVQTAKVGDPSAC